MNIIYGITKTFYEASLSPDSDRFLLSVPGSLKIADSIDATGVPAIDTAPFIGDYKSCYVHIVSSKTNGHLLVESGPHALERIFGITNKGSSTSPDSIEILFYSIPWNASLDVANITPYFWEFTQPNVVNFGYNYNERLEQLDTNTFRITLSNFIPDVSLSNNLLDVDGKLIYINDGDLVTKG